jgi:hypothetical protein|tara:strand:+ start:5270 stop:6076 length:807 start_codon:yes stop_codon:yes gene_type:complete
MVFIAGKFAADEILCQVPPHTLRIDLQQRRWKSDNDPDSAITDSNDNGVPIEFVLLGFTPFYGNLGMRSHEEFIRIAYVGVSPSHRLLPPRCVSTSVVSGKSSQKNFISYFQTLYNNRINVAEVITTTKFVGRSFTQTDPATGADTGKVNYNVLEFLDRPINGKNEETLVSDLGTWLSGDGGELVSAALRSHISGANLVELPFGGDHTEIKLAFDDQYPKLESAKGNSLSSLPAGAGDPKAAVPQLKSEVKELTQDQKDALKAAGLEV